MKQSLKDKLTLGLIVGTFWISAVSGTVNQYKMYRERREAVVVNRISDEITHTYCLGFDDDKNGEIDRIKEWRFMVGGRGACYIPTEFTSKDRNFENYKEKLKGK